MKKLLLSSLAALAFAAGSSAYAADLRPAYKAPPPPPAPVTNWTGCYIDGGIGYGMWNQDHVTETYPGLTAFSTTTTDGGRGWLGRAGGGCDYQVNRFVIGVFGDYDFMDLKGTNQPTSVFFLGDSTSGTEKESASWAVGGRIGYLVTPQFLTYVDGGYTQARFDQINLITTTLPTINTATYFPANTYNGWFLGGGTEYALDSFIPIHGLFLRTEYRYSSYDAANLPAICTSAAICGAVGPVGFAENSKKYVQTITTSLVWRFNFTGH
jgi:outer membrane immunogenic protein